MKYLTKKWQMILYGCAGIGVNMLNIMVGSYLCSALIADGFKNHVTEWTYLGVNLVVPAIWATLALFIKAFDGIVDIPLSNYTDNLRTKWGRRRPAILIGFVPMIIAYLLFLIPIQPFESVINTVWFAFLLFVFYGSYTLTMLTYYATFAEILKTEHDRVLVSNTKSICDVVYFSLGFALIPAFISMNLNIRLIALFALPLAATMLIPFFLIKERSTLEKDKDLPIEEGYSVPAKQERVNFVKSLGHSFKNKKFIYWLLVLATMNVGLQLFLGGINEFFSNTAANMTFVMASAFAPVPFTLILYNKFVKKHGLRFAYQYSLVMFTLGMVLMFFAAKFVPDNLITLAAIGCGILVSFGIGAFFSITYTVPSHLAAEENEKGGACASSMYFAVQGLFEGVAAGIATGPILTFLKTQFLVPYTTLVVAFFCIAAFIMAIFLPETFAKLGKKKDE